MNSLQVINENFIVNKDTGAISISQRKCAELFGVSRWAIQAAIGNYKENQPINNQLLTCENQELTSENLKITTSIIDEHLFKQLCKYFAYEYKKPTQEARNIMNAIIDGGIRAFLYTQAGYQFQVVEQPKLPQTYKEALRELLVVLDERDAEIEAHNETKLILEDKKVQLDESMNYLSIKRVTAFNGIPWRSISWRNLKNTGFEIRKIFDANYGNVNAYAREAWIICYPDLLLPTE